MVTKAKMAKQVMPMIVSDGRDLFTAKWEFISVCRRVARAPQNAFLAVSAFS